MIISDRARFVFVHNPKAAGTSVRRRLAPLDDAAPPFWKFAFSLRLGRVVDRAHIPLEDLERAYPRAFAKLAAYRSFTFVRDPYARTVSSFAEWCVRTGRKRKLTDPAWARSRFGDYVAALDPARVKSDPAWIHACPQHLFVFRRGVQVCARWGRTERFQADYAHIVDWIGLDPEAPPEQHNQSRHRTQGQPLGQGWYDAAASARVAAFYAADFELFGYDRAAP